MEKPRDFDPFGQTGFGQKGQSRVAFPDAAETLYKLQDSDINHFYTTSISTKKQVDRLLRDNLDGAGRRLNGKQLERTEIDWNKFM